MNKRKLKNATICDLTGEVRNIISNIEKKKIKDDIDWLMITIQEKAERMENRLSDYREAIENLGFIRDK